jgi:hypothetical protein
LKKGNVEVGAQINKLGKQGVLKRIKAKSWFSEKDNTINKSVTTLIRKTERTGVTHEERKEDYHQRTYNYVKDNLEYDKQC